MAPLAPNRLSSVVFILGLLVAATAVLIFALDGPSRPPGASAQGPNTITIVKDAVPDDAQDFQFTSGPVFNQCTPANFLLDDDTDPTLANSTTFQVAPGCNFFNTFTEIVPPGWVLTNIVCTVTGAVGATPQTVVFIGNNTGFDPGDDSVFIDLAAGEEAVCTFTNEKLRSGSIEICKQTDPPGGTGFNFGWSSPTIKTAPFTLDDGDCLPITDLDPAQGPYSFWELLPLPTGWQLSFITCSGGANVLIGSDSDYDPGDMSVTINLGPGENVTCTFINVGTGTRLWGDIDCNGGLEAVDALKLLRHVAALPVSQPTGCPDLEEEVVVVTVAPD